MRDLLGGKGANLAEMASIGLPVPPGFTITTEVCTAFYNNDRNYPARSEGAGRATRWRASRTPSACASATRPAAAGLRPLRRARLDARHDGHRAEPRPERRHRGGPGQRRRRRPLRLGLLPPLHPDVRLGRARRRSPPVRGDHRARQTRRRRDRGHRADRRRLAAGRRRLQGHGRTRRPASRSRRTRRNSSGARSAPCSAPG